jgi:hypothetical protein
VLRPCTSEAWATRDVERLLDSPTRVAYIETLRGIVASMLSGEEEDLGGGRGAKGRRPSGTVSA